MKTYRFGKKLPKRDLRTLKFAKYVHPDLPPPPPAYSSLKRLSDKLGTTDFPSLFPIDGNDRYGDCTMAGVAHNETLYNGLIGKRYIPAAEDVIKTYLDLSGGQDNGLVMLDVLKYWKNHGINGHKILGFAKIGVHDTDNVKRAITMFGSIYLGFQVQENAIPDFEAHKPWEPGEPDGGGHCVDDPEYDENFHTLITWGNLQKGTWPWWNQMVDEAYGVIPEEAEDPNFAPGFDIATLLRDLDLIAA
jgi:hypothetical protein